MSNVTRSIIATCDRCGKKFGARIPNRKLSNTELRAMLKALGFSKVRFGSNEDAPLYLCSDCTELFKKTRTEFLGKERCDEIENARKVFTQDTEDKGKTSYKKGHYGNLVVKGLLFFLLGVLVAGILKL